MWWNSSRPTAQEPTKDPEDIEGKMPVGRQETICGLRRKVFFFVILGGTFIAVAAIAMGIGAGIAFNKSSSYVVPQNLHSEPLSRRRIEADIRFRESKERILDASSHISCPDDRDAVIQSDDKYYRISCDVNYPESDGASDLDTRDASSIGQCVEMCSGEKKCMGVTWKDGECVLKKSVGKSREEDDMVLALGISKPDGAD